MRSIDGIELNERKLQALEKCTCKQHRINYLMKFEEFKEYARELAEHHIVKNELPGSSFSEFFFDVYNEIDQFMNCDSFGIGPNSWEKFLVYECSSIFGKALAKKFIEDYAGDEPENK